MTVLSGQRHTPHRPLKLVRTDNVGAGMHWFGGRVWVGERSRKKIEVEGGAGGVMGGVVVEKNKPEEGMRKSLRGGCALKR